MTTHVFNAPAKSLQSTTYRGITLLDFPSRSFLCSLLRSHGLTLLIAQRPISFGLFRVLRSHRGRVLYGFAKLYSELSIDQRRGTLRFYRDHAQRISPSRPLHVGLQGSS